MRFVEAHCAFGGVYWYVAADAAAMFGAAHGVVAAAAASLTLQVHASLTQRLWEAGMIRWFALCLAALIATAPAAFAYPPEEKVVVLQVGEAIGISIFQTPEAAVDACEAARKLIKPSAPKYLAFHVERCLGLVVEDGGVKGGKRCPHYKNALAIWKASPAPVDPNDEDAALSRAKFVREMKEEVAAYCTPGAAPPKKRDPNAMTLAPRAGATLETMEGLSYALPDGFGVASFDPDSGLANLRNPATGLGLRIERVALNSSEAKDSYPQKEVTPAGTRWEWEYKEFIPGSGFYVIYGKVTLANAVVVLGASDERKESKKGIDKDVGLALFRKIAESVRVTGPRKCIGECGPGTLK